MLSKNGNYGCCDHVTHAVGFARHLAALQTRNPVPSQNFRELASIEAGQCVQPVNTGSGSAGFVKVKPAGGQVEATIAQLLPDANALSLHVAQAESKLLPLRAKTIAGFGTPCH